MVQGRLIIFLLFLCRLSADGQEILFHVENDFETEHTSAPWINEDTRKSGIGHSGKYYSQTDSLHIYGGGLKQEFPDNCLRRNLLIRFSGWFRTNSKSTKYSVSLSVSSGDSTIYWQGINIHPFEDAGEHWYHITDSARIPASIVLPGNTFSIFLWNEEGKSVVDMDDLSIDFCRLDIPGWLVPPNPELPPGSFADFFPMYSDTNFRIEYDKMSGHVRISDAHQHIFIPSFSLFAEWIGDSEARLGKNSEWSDRFFPKKDSLTEEGTILQISARNSISNSVIQLLVSKDPPRISFQITTRFTKKVKLLREALIVNCADSFTHVYTHSSRVDSNFIEQEYWLAKEGIRTGQNKSGLVVYHTPAISSIQADVPGRRIVFNIDAAFDHPLLRWPLRKISSGHFEDCSPSIVGPENLLQGSFSFFKNNGAIPLPRFMQNPAGYLSAMVWTEHADYSDLRTQRAVWLGSDTIKQVTNASGGFARIGIPVTKSVFYENPEKIRNKGYGSDESCSIIGTPGFLELLKELDSTGNEICLHTPDPFTTKPEVLHEALAFMNKEFHSVSWIDHGYDNAKKSNREDLVCDGLDSTSKYFSADLWEANGLKYFWNCFYEDSSAFPNLGFNSSITLPYPGFGDAFPVPVYWRHPTRSGKLVHWRTRSTTDFSDDSWWNYFFSEERIHDFISQRGTNVIHCYAARIDSTNGFYLYKDGHFSIDPAFNSFLSRLAEHRRNGEIYLATIRELLDYRTALEQVDYVVLPDGKVKIHNLGSRRIIDLSMCIAANSVFVSSKKIKLKHLNGDLVFWFDLDAGEEVVISSGE